MIDLTEDAAGKLGKMERDYVLSEAEEDALVRLREEYSGLCREYNETEKEYINYEYYWTLYRKP